MTTPTIEQIHYHYTVRAYKPEPVPDEMIESIVAAGQRASPPGRRLVFVAFLRSCSPPVASTAEAGKARVITVG